MLTERVPLAAARTIPARYLPHRRRRHDVFHREPRPADHPFRTMDNVVATPHIAYGTDEGYRAFTAATSAPSRHTLPASSCRNLQLDPRRRAESGLESQQRSGQ